jgi:hypothetical protein
MPEVVLLLGSEQIRFPGGTGFRKHLPLNIRQLRSVRRNCSQMYGRNKCAPS